MQGCNSSQTVWRSVAWGKSIEWLCMEDRHSVKLSRLLAFDCAGIERLSVPQRNSCVSLGEPICIVCWHFSNLVRVLIALSQLNGPSRNVLYPAQLLETESTEESSDFVIFRRIWIAWPSLELFRGDFRAVQHPVFLPTHTCTHTHICRRTHCLTLRCASVQLVIMKHNGL